MGRKQAIRRFCVACMGGQRAEVARCSSPDCALHPFRMGRTIYKKGQFEELKPTKRESNSNPYPIIEKEV